jgi:ubiquinone/menaquinone biosynthesis C-methylase UbiE
VGKTSADIEERYDSYVRREWDQFHQDPSRAQASLNAIRGFAVQRILDIGCGAGQELLPFVKSREVLGIGLDRASTVGRSGRQLLLPHSLAGRVAFVGGAAENLPVRSGQIDLIVCRLALPYTRNAAALREMARVLRPGGLILLKIHHARFYLGRMKTAAKAADILRVAAGLRVLLAGAYYHVTGRQPDNYVLGAESFQTERLLRRELSRCGLTIRESMPDSNPRTPSFVIAKNATSQ